MSENLSLIEELRSAIKDYLDNVTDEQFEKDFEEVAKMPSSKCDVNILGEQ